MYIDNEGMVNLMEALIAEGREDYIKSGIYIGKKLEDAKRMTKPTPEFIDRLYKAICRFEDAKQFFKGDLVGLACDDVDPILEEMDKKIDMAVYRYKMTLKKREEKENKK